VFAGLDANLYDGVVQAAGGGAVTALSGNGSDLPPAAALAPDGRVHVVYTGFNRHLYWFTSAQPGTVHDLCDGRPADCFVVSDAGPTLAVGSDGAPVVVFHGTDGKLYGARLEGSVWSAAAAVSGGETTSLPPAMSGGVDGSLVDVVYVRDGDRQPRHARLDATGWAPPVTIAPVALRGAPALTATR
jgi:hypothetical protein